MRQQPVGEVAAARLGIDLDAGDEDAPVAAPAHAQGGRIDLEAMQPQLPVPERGPREVRLDRVESQPRATGGIVHLDVVQRQVRPQPLPVGVDALDGDGEPGRLRDAARDVLAVALDVRQHRVAQHQHQQGEAEVADPEQPDQRTAQPGRDQAGITAKTRNKVFAR